MRRMLLNYLLPIILPFAVYGIWLAYARYRARLAGHDSRPEWRDAPWTWLMVAAAALTAAGFATLAFVGGSPTDQKYIPPQYIDGVIVPSRME